MSDTYAIVETGGKQYRAEKGGSLVVEHLPAHEGAKVNLRAVMYRGDEKVVLDGKGLEKVKVEAVIAEHLRGPKLRVFKYKPKKGYRRRSGHRQELTRLEVTDVRLLTRKPAASRQQAADGRQKQAEAEPKKPAAKAKPTARQAAAKAKPATRKPAPKAEPARKPAATAAPTARGAAAKGKAQPKRKPSPARKRSSAKKEG
jgi:large subunit ribosomal protein L21